MNNTTIGQGVRVLIFVLGCLFFSLPTFAEYDALELGKGSSFFQGTEVLAGTEFPLQIGARLKIQLPAHFHMTFGLGYIPEFYADAFSGLSGGVGILGENTAELASRPLASAFMLDVRGAYSLDPDGGFFAELGYAFITGGGGEVSGDIVESAYDEDYAQFDEVSTLNIEGSLHSLTVHVGYLYLLTDRLSLIADVGVLKPVIATVETSASGTSAATAAQVESDIQGYVEDALVSQSFIPTASIWISYLF